MAEADSSERLYAATADEVVDLAAGDFNSARGWSRALYLGVAGDVVVILENSDEPRTYKAMAAGIQHSMSVKTVVKTGTTATDIVLQR